jgi:hypothetical protein
MLLYTQYFQGPVERTGAAVEMLRTWHQMLDLSTLNNTVPQMPYVGDSLCTHKDLTRIL